MKTLSIKTDDTTEYLVTFSILVMAVFIDIALFTEVVTEFTHAVANQPTIINPVLLTFLNSRLFMWFVFGCCIANGILIYKVLTEVYLLIMFILETAYLLYNRPKHLKGKKC